MTIAEQPPLSLNKTPQAELTDTDDDIAPGTIEVIADRTPAVSAAGSAAMVVASVTGRMMGGTARGAWTWLRWLGHGTRSASVLGYRYVRAHDHQEALGGISSGSDWNRVIETQHNRWRFLGWAGVGAVASDGITSMTLNLPWMFVPGVECVAAATVLSLYGRYRLKHQVPVGQLLAAEHTAEDDPDEPFPLTACTRPDEAAECLSRALYAESISTSSLQFRTRYDWGWEFDVTLKGSKPGKVTAALDDLETHMHMPDGGFMTETDTQNKAHLVVRLRLGDPFAGMAKPAIHAPNSLSVTDAHNLGRCMDGSDFSLVLEGNRILVIGVSGAAKSTGALRDLAELVTACDDAIALDLDPVKDGLREFEGVMAVPPIRGSQECEEWLGYLVRMCEARNAVRNRLKMGDTWVASREHPAIFPFVDEFIYLSPKAKELFIKLVRLGKQSGVYPTAAGQDSTSDSLGDAIADSFTLKIMLASRKDDVPIVFGGGAIAKGFLPHRLQPAQNKTIKNDAGRCYIQGPGFTRPLLYAWNEFSRDDIERAVKERATAGRPWFDHDTLTEAGLLDLTSKYGPAGQLTVADRLTGIGNPDAVLVAALLRIFDAKGREFLPTSEVLLPTLEAAGVTGMDATTLSKKLRAHAPGVTADRTDCPEGKHLRGWRREAVERAAAGLLDPAKTRQNPGGQTA